MKLLKYMGLAVMVGTISACTSSVGDNTISDGGKLTSGILDWPELDTATLPEGIFPNLENLDKIGYGVTKNDLYHLIGRPHFLEVRGAREWNYIMKFRQPDRSVKICFFKTLFDKEMVARSFYWKPADCLQKKREKFDLSADALFAFNRGGIDDIKPAGKAKLDALADRLVKEGNKAKVRLIGHTDYIGSDSYNLALSKQRANSVGRYLVFRGLNAKNISVAGMGESKPVKQCSPSLPRRQLEQCLLPNRRVSVEIIRR